MALPAATRARLNADYTTMQGRDAAGNTALHLACVRDCGDVIRVLIFNGAVPSITVRNEDGLKPRDVVPKTAKFKGQIDIVLREITLATATDSRWGGKPQLSELVIKKAVMSPEEISSSYTNYNLTLEVLVCSRKLKVC